MRNTWVQYKRFRRSKLWLLIEADNFTVGSCKKSFNMSPHSSHILQHPRNLNVHPMRLYPRIRCDQTNHLYKLPTISARIPDNPRLSCGVMFMALAGKPASLQYRFAWLSPFQSWGFEILWLSVGCVAKQGHPLSRMCSCKLILSAFTFLSQ